MTKTEAKLIDTLHRNVYGNGRAFMIGKREEMAGRSMERHGLVRWIDAGAPDSTDRGLPEIEWMYKWGVSQ